VQAGCQKPICPGVGGHDVLVPGELADRRVGLLHRPGAVELVDPMIVSISRFQIA
jgi:hypothetical protein